MFRIYRRFVFFKNFSIIVWSLFTGDLAVLIYSLGVDLDTLLGRPQTWLQALANAQEKIENLKGEAVNETRWERTKRFIYDYRWYLVGTFVVVSVGFIWILTSGGASVTPPPTPDTSAAATMTEDVLPKAPLVLPEPQLLMDQMWINAHTDEFLILKEDAFILEDVLPEGLPQQILDINNLNESTNICVTPIAFNQELSVAQILTREAPGNVVSYYVLPMPDNFQENPLIQEAASNALSQMNLRLAQEGLAPFEDATFVAIVNPGNSRGTLFLEFSSSSKIEWQHVSFKK